MLAELLKGAIGPIIGPLLDRIPDPNERAREKAAVELQLVTAANSALLAQIEVNKTEAASSSVFVAGWRPFVGWACGAGLTVPTVVIPLLSWAGSVAGMTMPPPPEIDTAILLQLLLGMLGLGGLRTFEKSRGVAR